MSLLESFVKNVFEKRVKPERGAILRCDLLGSLAHHTGVYLGDDRIAEVTENEDGWAAVREVSPETFLNGEGTSLNRSGAFIYVATDDDEVIAEEQVAELAEAMIGSLRGEYNLFTNNCHRFTCHCILGENPDDMKLTDDDVAEALEETFGVSSVKWNSTGFGCGDDSFDDVEYDDENEEDDDEDEDDEEDDDDEDEEDDDDEDEDDDDFDDDDEDDFDDDDDEDEDDDDFDDDDDDEDDDSDEDDEDEDEDDDEDDEEDDDEDDDDDEEDDDDDEDEEDDDEDDDDDDDDDDEDDED